MCSSDLHKFRTRNGEAEGAAIVSALVDLNLFSPVIRHLNEKACDIPTHLIVGEEAADNRVPSWVGEILRWKDMGETLDEIIANNMAPYTYADLFNDVEKLPRAYQEENSDWCVGLSSARWARSGLTGAQCETVGVNHISMTGDERIANRVTELLAGGLAPFGKPAASSLPQRAAARSRAAAQTTIADAPKIDEEAILARLLRLNLTASATTAAPGGTVRRPDRKSVV